MLNVYKFLFSIPNCTPLVRLFQKSPSLYFIVFKTILHISVRPKILVIALPRSSRSRGWKGSEHLWVNAGLHVTCPHPIHPGCSSFSQAADFPKLTQPRLLLHLPIYPRILHCCGNYQKEMFGEDLKTPVSPCHPSSLLSSFQGR